MQGPVFINSSPPGDDILVDALDAHEAKIVALEAERDAALAEKAERIAENHKIRNLIKQLHRAQFGCRSKKFDTNHGELALEDLEQTTAKTTAGNAAAIEATCQG